MRTIAPVLIALLVAGCGSHGTGDQASDTGSPGRGDRVSVLLITVDTLRPDHLSCYGWNGGKTPAFDELAREGTLCENAITPVPLTLPSHTTIMTGCYPPTTGVRNNGSYKLGDSPTTLAEVFKGAGYRTGAFIGAYVLDHAFGLARGFNVYDDRMPLTASVGISAAEWEHLERRADAVLAAAGDWLVRRPGEPFFAWVHIYDPHFPYSPPQPERDRYRDDPYSGEVCFVDRQLGRFFQRLRAAGLFGDRTLVVLTADHGESLGQHGEESHGIFLYDATVQVPLILRLPGKLAAGKRVTPMVRTLDIAPTILDLAGLTIPDRTEGISLVPFLSGDGPAPRLMCYLESLYPRENFGWAALFGVRTDSLKYIRAPERELYRLDNDRGELKNLAAEEADEAGRLDRRLAGLIAGFPEEAPGGQSRRALDPETIARLKSLGYIWSSHADAGAEERDPKQMLALNREREDAMKLVDAGHYEEGLSGLKSVAGRDPKNPKVWENLADVYLRGKNPGDALAAAERGLALQPDNPGLSILRGTLLSLLGRGEEAVEYLTGLLDVHPDRKMVSYHLASALEKLGRYDEALKQYRAAEAGGLNDPMSPFARGSIRFGRQEYLQAAHAFSKAASLKTSFGAAWHNLGVCDRRLGRPSDARRAYEKALALEPRNPLFHNDYGYLLYEQGQASSALAEYERALAIDPGFAAAHNNLARLYALGPPDIRNGAEALDHSAAAMRECKGSPPEDYLDVRAEALFSAGRTAEALKINAELLSARPEDQHYREQKARFQSAQQLNNTALPAGKTG